MYPSSIHVSSCIPFNIHPNPIAVLNLSSQNLLFSPRPFHVTSVSPHQDIHLLNIVLELPPAPAALVLLGLWFAVFSARSAAAFLRITVAGPPGGFGDAWRAVVEPEAAVAGD